jgi:2-methylisocitrate lyase-like PEP mutase family enzyme
MVSDTRRTLRALLAAPGPLVVPFAYDAFSARLIERAGFSAVGISGSAVAASLLGVPDVGLMSREEVVGQARRIATTSSLPVIADADTGYGGPLQAARTVQDLEAAGVAGLFMEDQRDPKRCGHLAGTEVIPTEEMVGKLTAALESRADPNFVIIARTDAIESEGLEAAAIRARTYLDAGADAAFVAAIGSREDLERLPSLIDRDAPLMVVLTEGGRTPLIPADDLATIGYKIVGFSGLAIGVAAKAVERGLRILKAQGTTESVLEDTMDLPSRNEVLDLQGYQDLEGRTTR